MSKTLRNVLIALTLILGAAALVLVGMYFGRMWWSPWAAWPGNNVTQFEAWGDYSQLYGPGMMGSGMMGPGMMGPGMMGSGMMGPGMMGPGMMGPGMMGSGMMGPGMMGAYGFQASIEVEPLSLSEAEAAVEAYLGAFANEDLAVGEIMVFDNHAYAQIVEKSTGIGAMELLVDPITKAVSPEFGPNMMWNLKYSPMAGTGMMGMMSGQYLDDLPAEMRVSTEEAVRIAQRYLDAYLPGSEVGEAPDPFYGYYTLHFQRGGSTVGMLSVNGYSGDVFLHTWHGELIEMSEDHP